MQVLQWIDILSFHMHALVEPFNSKKIIFPTHPYCTNTTREYRDIHTHANYHHHNNKYNSNNEHHQC